MMITRADQTGDDLLAAAEWLRVRGWQREHNRGRGISMTIMDALTYEIGGSFNRLTGDVEAHRLYAAIGALDAELAETVALGVIVWNATRCRDAQEAIDLLRIVGSRLKGQAT